MPRIISSSRFNRHALGVFLTMLLAAILVVAVASIQQAGSKEAPSMRRYASPATQIPLEALGQVMSLEAAEVEVGFKIKLPTYLPHRLELKEIRVLGQAVSLLYVSATLSPLPEFQEDVSMVIEQRSAPSPLNLSPFSPDYPLPEPGQTIVIYPNGTQIVVAEHTPERPTGNLIVRGEPGIGYERSESGFLMWWEDDVMYKIGAQLSLSEIIDIAESIK